MKVGIGASTDVQATVDRCKKLGVERVYISCASIPGYQEDGYPDPASRVGIVHKIRANWRAMPALPKILCRYIK